ncbi:MAG: Scr1 family TA system antitoxin-like transcriptional regulator [Pseudonocardiaceae bacterium]
MPGLLQTTDYARALIRESGTIPADEIEDRVAARLGRQVPAPDRVLVRDSKDRDGPALAVPTAAWRDFLRTVTH